MNIQLLRALALSGGEWVIYMLLAGSVLAVAVTIERFIVLWREGRALEDLRAFVLPRLAEQDLASVARDTARLPGMAARMLEAGLNQAGSGAGAAEEHMAAAGLAERTRVERRLMILGTLGNNAPFVGLFGTVLGVIKAFHELAENTGAGPEAVMAGLSEALIATAAGLLVAIPCVVAYNYFQKRVKDLAAGAEALDRLLLARLKTEHASGAAAGKR